MGLTTIIGKPMMIYINTINKDVVIKGPMFLRNDNGSFFVISLEEWDEQHRQLCSIHAKAMNIPYCA